MFALIHYCFHILFLSTLFISDYQYHNNCILVKKNIDYCSYSNRYNKNVIDEIYKDINYQINKRKEYINDFVNSSKVFINEKNELFKKNINEFTNSSKILINKNFDLCNNIINSSKLFVINKFNLCKTTYKEIVNSSKDFINKKIDLCKSTYNSTLNSSKSFINNKSESYKTNLNLIYIKLNNCLRETYLSCKSKILLLINFIINFIINLKNTIYIIFTKIINFEVFRNTLFLVIIVLVISSFYLLIDNYIDYKNI